MPTLLYIPTEKNLNFCYMIQAEGKMNQGAYYYYSEIIKPNLQNFVRDIHFLNNIHFFIPPHYDSFRMANYALTSLQLHKNNR